ncbi:unnamed protein product, partial [Candidula unifasciata]
PVVLKMSLSHNEIVQLNVLTRTSTVLASVRISLLHTNFIQLDSNCQGKVLKLYTITLFFYVFLSLNLFLGPKLSKFKKQN